MKVETAKVRTLAEVEDCTIVVGGSFLTCETGVA